MRLLGTKDARSAFAAGAPPRTPRRELTALPQPPELDLRRPILSEGEGMGRQRSGERV